MKIVTLNRCKLGLKAGIDRLVEDQEGKDIPLICPLKHSPNVISYMEKTLVTDAISQ